MQINGIIKTRDIATALPVPGLYDVIVDTGYIKMKFHFVMLFTVNEIINSMQPMQAKFTINH